MTYEQEIAQLEQELETIQDFSERMEKMDEILEIKKKHGKIIPGGEYFQCVGCSS